MCHFLNLLRRAASLEKLFTVGYVQMKVGCGSGGVDGFVTFLKVNMVNNNHHVAGKDMCVGFLCIRV